MVIKKVMPVGEKYHGEAQGQDTIGHRGELGGIKQKDWVFDDLNHEDLGTSSQARAPLGV